MNASSRCCLVGLLCVAAADARAADWPTYRADAMRSGYTADRLPRVLECHWTRVPRHAPRPAWSGRDTRTPFDRAFHVAVGHGMVFFGSSADGAVRALRSDTGAQVWAAFTDGPVRFAPTLWRDRLFVAGDDGFLTCLAAKDGRVLWRRRGGPVDSLVLGNGRMISRWPARGGPAVADDTVYFAAGIWPSEGIYLYALDAGDGAVKWCNDTAGFAYTPQPHGGANARSGVSANGYLVATGGRLLVPTGRGVPAGFDRATGKLLYFHLQRYGQIGGSAIVADGARFYNGGCAFEAAGGSLIGAGIPPRAMALAPEHLVYAKGGEVLAIPRANAWAPRKGKGAVPAEPVWRMASPHGATRVLIAAGSAVAAGGDGRVSVLDRASSAIMLDAEVDGAVEGLAAAGGRLFVSTDQGAIHCYGGPGKPAAAPPARDPAPDDEAPAYAAAADAIVRAAGMADGYCVDLACGDGALACALAKRTRLQIIAVDADPKMVARTRQRLDRAGLLGVRVSVVEADPARNPLPSGFANLVVSGRSVTAGARVAPAAEAARLLRPYGGVALLGRAGAMSRTVRGPLEGGGAWTHQYCDPANSNCSTDTVKGPLGLLWFTDFDFQMPSRHGRGPAPLFHKGWLYVEGMDAVRCVDAYNGRTVWECPLPGILKAYDADHIVGAAATGSNLCVAEGGVYVRLDDKCLRLDPATGKRLGELQAPKQPDGTPGDWGYLASVGDTVFGSLSDTDHVVKWAYRRADMSRQFGESLLLFALDAATGEPRWTYRPEHSIRNNTIAIGRGRVFVIDRPVSLRDLLDQDAAKRKGRPVGEHPTGKLIALNAADGKPVWTVSEGIYGTLLALSEEHGVVVMAYQSTRFRLASETGGRMAAFRASDGRRLWDIAAKYGSRPILNGRTLYAQPGAWDLLTGEAKPFTFERSYGCGTVSGSRNLLLFRSATLGYVDLAAGVGTEDYGGVRPGCWINAIAAGGLVLMPDATDQCRCSYLIKASVALQPYGLRAPAVSPAGGAFRTPVTATLSQGDSRAEIRYTVDGSPPSATSLRYTAPLRLATSATVMARAFAPGLPPSRVAEARFTIDPHILPIDGPHWKVIDAPHGTPPASDWRVADGVVIERSNLFQGAAGNSDPRTERPGALRVYTPGAKHADGELSLDLMSSDNDGLGVAFRFQGADRHYLWAMDQQRGFHILALKDRDTYRVLASRKAGYRPNQWYRLKVTLRGSKLAVHLDGQMDLEVDDATVRTGSFALYAWGCAGARFRNVRWK